jgi:hypothetical protein
MRLNAVQWKRILTVFFLMSMDEVTVLITHYAVFASEVFFPSTRNLEIFPSNSFSLSHPGLS